LTSARLIHVCVGGVFLRPKSMPMHEGEETVGVPAVAEADG
jgi:hypothetical protein